MKTAIFLLAAILSLTVNLRIAEAKKNQPNVVMIFLDDSGFGDFAPFGNPKYATPHVARLAEEAVRFDQFYVPQAICSASRAALLSGCYPGRTGVFGAHGPNGRGLPTQFATIAEVLKTAGYTTAHFGKWHCGDQEQTRPLARGFDEHAGIMYSNDMWRFHPGDPVKWGKHPLRFWENGKIKIEDVSKLDQANFTRWITEYACDFITRQKDQPFFLYVAHPQPHVPLFCSKDFEGKSGQGLYGDVIMELDWSVGQINQTLKDSGLDQNTLVFFSSDNGPWTSYGHHAGTTPYREAKATSFDGGIRSATLIKYPPLLKAGTRFEKLISSIDMLPTIVHLAGAKPPANEIDGKNVIPYITHQSDQAPHSYYPISTGKTLESIVSGDGKWKLHLPHGFRMVETSGQDGLPGKFKRGSIKLSLFDMIEDPKESNNVIQKHPELAEKLQQFARTHQSRFYGRHTKKNKK